MIRIAAYAALVLLTLAALALLWQFRLALVLLALSLAIASAFRPLIDYWERRGLPRSIATFLSYFLVLSVVIALFVLAFDPLLQDVQRALDDFLVGYEMARTEWPVSGNAFQRMVAAQLLPGEDLAEFLTSAQGAAVLRAVLGVASRSAEGLNVLAIAIVLSIYWGAERDYFERLWLSVIPAHRRAQSRDIWHAIEAGVGLYVRDQLVLSILVGLILGLGYAGLGLRYPILLALFGILSRFIPWLGPLLALIPPVLVGLSSDPGTSMVAGAFTLIVFFLLETVVEARFFTRPRHSSLLFVLLLVALAEALGLLGILIAPPLAVAVHILFRSLVLPAPRTAPEAHVVEEFSRIRERIVSLREMAEGAETSPELQNLLARLVRLAERAGEIMPDEEGGEVDCTPVAR